MSLEEVERMITISDPTFKGQKKPVQKADKKPEKKKRSKGGETA